MYFDGSDTRCSKPQMVNRRAMRLWALMGTELISFSPTSFFLTTMEKNYRNGCIAMWVRCRCSFVQGTSTTICSNGTDWATILHSFRSHLRLLTWRERYVRSWMVAPEF